MEDQFTNENTWVNAQLLAHRKHGQLSLPGCIPRWVGRPGGRLKDQPFPLNELFRINAFLENGANKLGLISSLVDKNSYPVVEELYH